MPLPTMRASQIPESIPKDGDFSGFSDDELEYPPETSWRRLLNSLVTLPENMMWNTVLCVLTLLAILILSLDFESPEVMFGVAVSRLVDIAYNVMYGLYVVAHMLSDCYSYHHEKQRFPYLYWFWYVLDGVTYLHYVTWFLPKMEFMKGLDVTYVITMACYYVRLRRIFVLLLSLNDYYLRGSIVETLIKYWYILLMVRVISANAFAWLGLTQEIKYKFLPEWLKKSRAEKFYQSFYVLDKRFFSLGIDRAPDSDLNRVISMIVMVMGALLLSGISIAALALIISVRMKSEYKFRARFLLIINDMKVNSVPIPLRQKVETFYKIYWHKQKAVSVTRLLPTYPPNLICTVYTDIYFEALQKSRILRDLSYQFLSELAKRMRTVNYVPGDVIIKRKSNKFAVVYIAYGDVEMVTAEDDETPILRFTRGTILNPSGVCVDVASSTAHVTVRAATFCTAHVLKTADLWRVAVKHGNLNGQTYIIHSAFDEHLDRVVRHYAQRPHPPVKHKTTIMQLKRNIIELKQARDDKGKLLMSRSDVFLQIADCYIMRNQADLTALTEESDAICLRSTFPCILQPTSDLQILWKIFVAAITVVVTFVLIYYRVYKQAAPIKFLFFNFLVTVIYVLDIIVYLSTGANIEEGVPLTFLQTSTKQMQSLWFVLDVVAAAPIFEFVGNGEFIGMNKLCKLFYVFRTMKLLEDTWVFHSATIRFVSLCMLMVILSWLVAALDHGFLCFHLNFCRIFNFLDGDAWEFNKTATTPDEIADLLSYSIYWAVSFTTFTGHPTAEGTVRHFPTQVQVMFILEICGLLHIFVQAVYAATIIVTEQLRNQYYTCIDNVQHFLEKNDVDPEVRHRFINYLQLCWYTDKAYRITNEKSSILFDLPKHVYENVAAMERNKYILCIPFMKELPEPILRGISGSAHLFYISPNEILMNTGDISNEIYVIKQGFCEVLDPETKKVVTILQANNHFGDMECLMRHPAYYSVRAVTHVEVFTVSRKNLMTAISTMKINKAIMYAKLQPEYHRLLKNRREQFLKYESPPPPGNRMRFRLPRKHETDEAFLEPFRHIGFFSVFRYVFPRFTIRPDGPYLRRHEYFRAFCAFLSALLIPSMYLLMMQFPWIYYITLFLDLAAYFDVVQRLLVGYFNEKGVLVYHPVSTTGHYIKGALAVDLLGCLPLENLDNIVIYLNSSKDYTIVSKTMELLLFNRCLQLYRLPAALGFLDNYIKRRDVLYCIKIAPLFMVMMSSVGTLISSYSMNMVRYNKGGWKLIPRRARFTSWIKYNATNVGYNITKTPFNLWLTTYYWATSQLTSTGFGVFLPHSRFLLVLFTLSMLFATVVTMYFSVRLLSFRSNVNQALATFQHDIKDMITFMKREMFHKDLQREVLSYYEYTWEKTRGTKYSSVFKLCDQITLRTDTILHIYGETFRQCSILHNCDTSLLRLLSRAMHSVYFRRDMMVIQRRDVVSELYIIDYGSVQVRHPVDHNNIEVILPRGSLFGNLNNVHREISTNSFVVNSNVHLLRIDSLLFYKILQDFPDTKTSLAALRPNEENYVIGFDSANPVKHTYELSTGAVQRYWLIKCVIIYLIIICLLCIFLDVYNAGFLYNAMPLIYVLYSLDLAFVPKIFINLLFPHVSEQKRGSKEALRTARRKYIRGEFKYDIISLLPLELFCLCFHNPWSVFAYFRLNRYFRVITVNSCIQRYSKMFSTDLTWPNIIAMAINFSLFIHTLTCIWYSLAYYQDQWEPKSSWRWHKPLGPLNQLSNTDNACHESWYICCMYFIITTIMQNGGAHDVLPRKQIEVIFICVLMLLSMMMMMIFVGEFARIIHYRSYRCFDFYDKYLELQEYLKNNRVCQNLEGQVKKYTLHLWREARGLQSPQLVNAAPRCLRLKIMAAAYMKDLMGTPVFKNCEPDFLRHLVGYLTPYYYEGNMYVVRDGEITNSMYFVHKGRVKELIEETEENGYVLNEGMYFGTVNGLYRDVAFTNSYKTEIKSQILRLDLDSWEYLLSLFPVNRDLIYRNMKDPKIGDEFLTKKWTKARSFPPKSMMIVNEEPPKTGSSLKDEPKLSSDEITLKTQQLLNELRKINEADPLDTKQVSTLILFELQSLADETLPGSLKKSTSRKKLAVLTNKGDVGQETKLTGPQTESNTKPSETPQSPSEKVQSLGKRLLTKFISPKKKARLSLDEEQQNVQSTLLTEEPMVKQLTSDSPIEKLQSSNALSPEIIQDIPEIIESYDERQTLASKLDAKKFPTEEVAQKEVTKTLDSLELENFSSENKPNVQESHKVLEPIITDDSDTQKRSPGKSFLKEEGLGVENPKTTEKFLKQETLASADAPAKSSDKIQSNPKNTVATPASKLVEDVDEKQNFKLDSIRDGESVVSFWDEIPASRKAEKLSEVIEISKPDTHTASTPIEQSLPHTNLLERDSQPLKQPSYLDQIKEMPSDKKRKSTTFEIDKEAFKKELADMDFDQDDQEPSNRPTDLTQSTSPPKDTQTTRSSLEEVELGKLSYSKEEGNISVRSRLTSTSNDELRKSATISEINILNKEIDDNISLQEIKAPSQSSQVPTFMSSDTSQSLDPAARTTQLESEKTQLLKKQDEESKK